MLLAQRNHESHERPKMLRNQKNRILTLRKFMVVPVADMQSWDAKHAKTLTSNPDVAGMMLSRDPRLPPSVPPIKQKRVQPVMMEIK